MSSPRLTTTRAVILARGLGTRMRKADIEASLDPAQAAAADSGIKGMIPIGRPFMDYLISALADAGFTDVCLVIGPDHEVVRRYYGEEVTATRVRIRFAVQEQPLGTADAVIAAEAFSENQPFVVINSDNYYPAEALAELHRRTTPALIAFHRTSLVTLGNVTVEKLARFGSLAIDTEGCLRKIVATSAPGTSSAASSTSLGMSAVGEELYASLNCWLFTSEIFRACTAVRPSARGELELPQAVMLAIDEGWMSFEAVRVRAGVLDMSNRGDIASVAERLAGTVVHL